MAPCPKPVPTVTFFARGAAQSGEGGLPPLAAGLACSVAGVPLGLLVGQKRGLTRLFLFLLARRAGSFRRGQFFLVPLLLGFRSLALLLYALAVGDDLLALGAAACDLGIVGAG